MTCLHENEVIDIILKTAPKRFVDIDRYLDNVMRNIAGRYFFATDDTLEDYVSREITKGNLVFNPETKLIRRA